MACARLSGFSGAGHCPVNEQSTIRLCGRAFPNVWRGEQQVETVLLTQDQAQELVSSLNMALLELEPQRAADLARAAEGAGYPQSSLHRRAMLAKAGKLLCLAAPDPEQPVARHSLPSVTVRT
ncbi:hypothetical protein [Paraburkholderia sp. DGU8]|jgi:hypothetical protein|uniref:hypothetical protein n=1 Tax=Paraburkholderia sp. DGU8 TaxID=3161997 RepID=UPI003467E38C